MSLERALAEWAARAGDFGPRARELAQDALVDIVACMIGGSVEPPTSAVATMARQLGTGRASGLINEDRLPAPWAALVSGTAAHALDFDDNFAPAVTHATAVLAPALFGLADEEGASGSAVIDAYIVGLELQARIGHLVNPRHYERGWHATSTIGAIGTAGACARLLGLNTDQTLAAMSIAFSMAAGSKKQFGSMMKPIHAGLAAKNAVLASRMAAAGITGDSKFLTGPCSFSDLYDGEADVAAGGEAHVEVDVEVDVEVAGAAGGEVDNEVARDSGLEGPASSLAIEAHGLMAKRYPCCGAAHRTLDGVAELRSRHGFNLEDVDHIEAFIPEFARANLRFDHPEDEMQARFSLTYCAARVLQKGRLELSDMTIEQVQDPAIRPWLDRLVIHVRPGSVCDELGESASPAVTRVMLRNGETLEAAIVVPRGTRSAPFTLQEQREKFDDCCRWAGQIERAGALFELARSLGRYENFREFSQSFAQAWIRK